MDTYRALGEIPGENCQRTRISDISHLNSLEIPLFMVAALHAGVWGCSTALHRRLFLVYIVVSMPSTKSTDHAAKGSGFGGERKVEIGLGTSYRSSQLLCPSSSF